MKSDSNQRQLEAAPLPAHLMRDERLNILTHGIGLVLSLAGSVALIACAISQGDAWRLTGCSIFAATLVAVYGASTLSHTFTRPRLRHFFRSLDQAAIYLLIAGTYTPFALVYLRFGWWWLLFGAMWTIGLAGFFSKMLFSHRVDSVSIWIYVLMGWLPIVGAAYLVVLVPTAAMLWVLIGGVFYTLGAFFLAFDARREYFHAVWHVFVIAGSACHFFAILAFVAMSAQAGP